MTSANIALCHDVTVMLMMLGLAFRDQPLYKIKIPCISPTFILAICHLSMCEKHVVGFT